MIIKKNKNDIEQDDETPISIFQMKYFFYKKKLTDEDMKLNKSPLRKITNCLCLLTNKNVIVFKLMNSDLFNQNIEFDTCLKRKLTIDINQIETIEIGVGQNYLIVEKNVEESNSKIINYKFVTLDIYQSQAFLSILLSK